jgi:hypothetical protein
MGMGFAMANQMGQALNPQAQQQPPQQAAAPGGPPPLPNQASFYVAVNGQQAGPFDTATLQQKVAAGQVTRETLVWKQGMSGWAAAGQVTELSSLFGATPPPLPPQG